MMALGVSYFIYFIIPCLSQNNISLITYFLGVMTMFVIAIFFKYMPKRTEFGIKILGKISGFKNFLERAEKQKLESLVMSEPYYFYDILPYTYALGVSDKWISQFESILLEQPNWYNTSNSFNIVSFSTSMDRIITSISTTSSSGSGGSSSGSSSSGGGSSGGGSGGGGGGSW